MTQQNAALVDEGASAADSLRDQAGRLTQMVGTFRLTRNPTNEGTSGAASRAAPPSGLPMPAPSRQAVQQWPTLPSTPG